MTLARGYASLARMLEYPEEKETILAGVEEVGRMLPAPDGASPLERFGRFVHSTTLARLQEEYVATFDFNPAVAPYLGHHLFGDNRKKGAYLIRLKQEFARHGFVPSANELPDHLPLLLDFLAHLATRADDEVRRSLISECVLPGVERLVAGFSARRDSPWKAVADAAGTLCSADTNARKEGRSR
jgi:nitrate reductase delta subunit